MVLHGISKIFCSGKLSLELQFVTVSSCDRIRCMTSRVEVHLMPGYSECNVSAAARRTRTPLDIGVRVGCCISAPKMVDAL